MSDVKKPEPAKEAKPVAAKVEKPAAPAKSQAKDDAKPVAKPEVKKPAEPAKTTDAKPVDSAKPGAIDPTQTSMTTAWKYAQALTSCRFDPSGKYVFAGTQDYTIQRFRTADGAATPLVGHESWVRAFTFPLAGSASAKQTLVSGGYDGKLLWWNVDDEKPVPMRNVAAHDGWVRAVAASNDGKQIASCGNDGLVKLWNTADGKLARTFAKHDTHAYHVAFHPDGERLVSCDLKCVCKVWNLKDGKLEREFTLAPIHKYDTTFRADMGGARSIGFGDGGKLLTIGGTSNITNAFAGIGNATWVDVDWADGKQKTMHVPKEKVNGTAWGLAWHPEGFLIGAAGGQGGFLYFFKPGQAEEFFKLKLPEHARDMALAPDGKTVVVAHADGNLRTYRLFKA